MSYLGQPASVWVLLVVASWLAATVSGAAGFGGALLLLPVLSNTIGPKAAVPVLTVAQLLGNLSRVWFGRDQIAWRPVGWFVLGAIPAGVLGSLTFASLPKDAVLGGIGVVLLLIVAARHSRFSGRKMSHPQLASAGAVVGFLSAVAGSAGPLGAAVFLGLDLAPVAYVASEAVTAVGIHVTKSVVYQRFQLVGLLELAQGLLLGGAMIVGSWTGKKVIERIPRERFVLVVEVLLVLSGAQLIATALL